MVLPVKQGLKLVFSLIDLIQCGVEVVLPVKQGLKPFSMADFDAPWASIVEVVLPVKQGLKRAAISAILSSILS